jgi:hypothetical protein
MTKHALLKAVRLTHLYFGVLIAPALLFFSFTGFLQTFSLHETTRGSSYVPPAIIVKLANIHKKATLPGPPKQPKNDKPQGGERKPDQGPAQGPQQPQSFHWPEKLFFGTVAIGLFTSTLTGLYMSWMFARRKIFIVALFLAGAILPLVLLPF